MRLSLIFWASRKPKIVFYKEALSFEVYSQYSQLVRVIPVRYRIWLLAILASVSVGASPIRAQALLPHTTRINFGNLEEQALNLAREAAQLAQFEQYELALPRARLAVQLAPKAFQTQGILGSIYLRKERYDEAIASLTLAHQLKKDEPTILFSLGAAYLRNKNYPEAISNLKQGLTIDPKAATAMFGIYPSSGDQKCYSKQEVTDCKKSVRLPCYGIYYTYISCT